MIVIDASVALKWVLDEEGSDAALALRQDVVAAPAIWIPEAGNALWRRAKLGEISGEGAERRFRSLLSAPIRTTPIELEAVDALKLATSLAHPIYDCLYLALAMREDTHVVTADRSFAALASRRADLSGRIRALV